MFLSIKFLQIFEETISYINELKIAFKNRPTLKVIGEDKID
jgi:hypothetical protein